MASSSKRKTRTELSNPCTFLVKNPPMHGSGWLLCGWMAIQAFIDQFEKDHSHNPTAWKNWFQVFFTNLSDLCRNNGTGVHKHLDHIAEFDGYTKPSMFFPLTSIATPALFGLKNFKVNYNIPIVNISLGSVNFSYLAAIFYDGTSKNNKISQAHQRSTTGSTYKWGMKRKPVLFWDHRDIKLWKPNENGLKII